MGEIAEMMLNGDLDCYTGEYLGEGDGYPRSLDDDYNKSIRKHNMKPSRRKKNTPCTVCNKLMRGEQGLKMHLKDKHGI